jgi:UDP-N-acetylglucosamine diphosphorylase/glucosamine-1-phosphate N-acetyltransferase
MPAILLYDTPFSRNALYPLTLTRPVCHLRQGIVTTRQWWQIQTGLPVFAITVNYLQEKIEPAENYICVDASVIPDAPTIEKILALRPRTSLEDERGMIAFSTENIPAFGQQPVWANSTTLVSTQLRIVRPWHLFQGNAERIRQHYGLHTSGKTTAAPSISNTIIGNGGLFLEEGVTMDACTINTTEGPVFIGKNTLVMEGTLIRGPVAICEGAVIKMGTRLYGGTTIGPFCTAGGEIKNSILMAYSNKAHDGYLGDSVVGEWCNFGAGSSNSNVKNTGGEVKMWDQQTQNFIAAGNKAGLIMGDYSRCAINSSINTGTTIGVSCNVFDGTYPAKHLPSFSWGNFERYEFNKACSDAANWKKMKGVEFTAQDRLILRRIWEELM